MAMKYFLLSALLISFLSGNSQDSLSVKVKSPAEKPARQLFVTFFNNATATPFSGKAGIIHLPVHPGVSAGLSFPVSSNKKSLFSQNFRLGVYHQRFTQTGIQLYTETGYRRDRKSVV